MCYHAKKTHSMCYHNKKTGRMCYYGKKTDSIVIMAKYFLVPLFYKRVRRFYVAHMNDRIVFSCSVFFLPKTSVTTQQRFEG